MKYLIKICFSLVAVLFLTAACEEDKDPIVPVTGLEISFTELSLAPGVSWFLETTILPDNATDKSITCSSDNENVVMVEAATGKITAVKGSKGEATITVRTNDGNFPQTCVVTVTESASWPVNLIKNPGFEASPGTATSDAIFNNWTIITGGNDWWTDYYGAGNFGSGGGANNAPDRIRFDHANFEAGQNFYDVKDMLTGRYFTRIQPNQRAALYQEIRVEPGKSYTFGADVAFRKNNNNMSIKKGETLKILGPDENGKWIVDIGFAEIPVDNETASSSTTSYVIARNVNGIAKIPEGVTRVRFLFSQWSSGTNGTQSPLMFVDECYFIELTE